MDRIYYGQGLTVDLERICAIKEDFDNGLFQLIVKYNSCYTYSQNPFDNSISKDLMREVILKDYRNFEYAREAYLALTESWSDYLKTKN